MDSSQTKEESLKEQQSLSWLRNKLGALWMESQFCGLCLETKGNFFPLKNELAISESNDCMPLIELIGSIMNIDVEHHVSSDVICKDCAEKTIQSYMFIERTKKLLKVVNNCVKDILSKVTDINNELNGTHEQANLNVMIVAEYDKETIECINEAVHRFGKDITVEVLKKESTVKENQNKGPVIIPTQRVIKHPRHKHKVIRNEPVVEESTPTFSLQDGKIVITPLTTTLSAPKYNTYSCNSCLSIFTTYRSLKEHEKTVHNATVYQCRFCSKKYNSQQYLDVHYANGHSKSRCRHCHELFDTTKLNNHLKEAHEKQVHVCKFCDLVYYTSEQLETHTKSSHFDNVQSDNNKTQCIMCLRNFLNNEIKTHKCKFSCLECLSAPCVHHSYLMSYREQILSHATKIRCLDCDFTTKRKEHLIAHVNREHLDHHPFTCHDCGTQFYTKLSLKTHIEQFHQDLKCQYCDHEFKTSKLFHQHRKLCKSIARPFLCDVCVASFDTSEELLKHTNTCQSDIVYPCTLCKKEFTSEKMLQTHHIRVHSGIQVTKRRKFMECTLCGIIFNNRKEMTDHEQSQHENEMFPCRLCSKQFTSLLKMNTHKRIHYSNRTNCENCNKSVLKSVYKQHVAVCSKFKNGLPHVCKICNKGFHIKSALIAHKQIHANPVPCDYCLKLIKPSSMKTHIEVKHLVITTAKTLYKCQHCNYVSKKRNELENHVNKIHLKIKPFVCDVCSKSFCGKGRLDEHLRTHSVDNTCFCNFCGKKFANKVCLKMHTRRHTGERPYECNICFEKFRSSSIMKTHRLKKHQDKTIQCPLCESMYHLVAEMRFHVKKTHWKRPEPFDFREIVPKEHHHLFEDRRLQKLGES